MGWSLRWNTFSQLYRLIILLVLLHSASVTQVRKELPKAFPKAKDMHKSSPLTIVSSAKMNDNVGFKERDDHPPLSWLELPLHISKVEGSLEAKLFDNME